MRVLLVGDYEPLAQQSMRRFVELMYESLRARGHDVRVTRPPVRLGRILANGSALGKWLGYLDRYILYFIQLRRESKWAEVVHICDQANAVYVPLVRGKPHVVTCHDMLAIRSAKGEIAQSPIRWSGRVYQAWILSCLKRAQRVVCVSQQTAREVRSQAGIAYSDLDVVPNALNYPYRRMDAVEAATRLRRLGLDENRPYFIHVGGNQWYKNRPGVVRIYAELLRHPSCREHDLVLVGQPWNTELTELVNALGLRERVVERVGVSNEDLCALYSSAEMLVFPSLQEGFGWPVVEAQACGCPVAVTARPPMTEVAGDAAVHIDPEDPPGAAALIAASLTRARDGREPSFQNAAQFSRDDMVAGYIHAYRAVRSAGGNATSRRRTGSAHKTAS